MNKLLILVICALVGAALARKQHHKSGKVELTGSSSQGADAAIKLSLDELTKGFGGLLGADGKPVKSGSYSWSYSSSGGAADAGLAAISGLTGGLNAGSSKDIDAAIKLKLDGLMKGAAESGQGKTGSYKWSYSTSGGASDAGAGKISADASKDANAAIKLSLGGLVSGTTEVKPAKSGSYKWSYSSSSGGGDSSAGKISSVASKDASAAVKLSLDGLLKGVAENNQGKSGSYKYSYSTSGGASDASAGKISADASKVADAAIKLSLGGVTSGLTEANSGKSGSYKWSYSSSGGAAGEAKSTSSSNVGSSANIKVDVKQDSTASQDAVAGIDLNISGHKHGHHHGRGHGRHGRHHESKAEKREFELKFDGKHGRHHGKHMGRGHHESKAEKREFELSFGGKHERHGRKHESHERHGRHHERKAEKREFELSFGGKHGRHHHGKHEWKHGRHHESKNSNAELNVNLAGISAGLNVGGSGSSSSSGFSSFSASRSFSDYATITFNGMQFVIIGNKYYWIDSTTTMNWFDAHHTCRSKNAQLLTIESEEEMIAINGYLRNFDKKDGKRFWTAGNDLGKEGEFKWASNGRAMTYSNWSPNQPDNFRNNEHCVELMLRDSDDYKMNDTPCTYTPNMHVICEIDLTCTNVGL